MVFDDFGEFFAWGCSRSPRFNGGTHTAKKKGRNPPLCHPCVGSPHPTQPREMPRGVSLGFPLLCNAHAGPAQSDLGGQSMSGSQWCGSSDLWFGPWACTAAAAAVTERISSDSTSTSGFREALFILDALLDPAIA